MPAGLFSGCDAVAGEGDGNGLVGVAVEIPEGRIERSGAVVFRGGAAAGNGGGEESGTARDHIPCACSTHRLTCHIDPTVINRALVAHRVDDFQRERNTLAWPRVHFVFVLLEFFGIVPDPAAVGLRHQHITRMSFLVFWKEPHARAEDISEPELFGVVLSLSTAAVQVDDERKLVFS